MSEIKTELPEVEFIPIPDPMTMKSINFNKDGKVTMIIFKTADEILKLNEAGLLRPTILQGVQR